MKSLINIIFCFAVLSCFSAVKEIKGVFKGENLVLRNFLNEEDNTYCLTDIYLNGERLVIEVNHMTIEVPLRDYLQKGAHVSLRLYHRANCQPEVVNPGVIQRKTLFAFLAFEASQKGFRWTTRGETADSYYLVQRVEEGRWKTVLKEESNARMSGNIYDVEFDHFSGFSVYRVKYVQTDGFKEVSDKFKFRSHKIPVSFFPTKVKDYLTFVNNHKKPIAYKVYSINGQLVLEGKGLKADCRTLEPKKMYTLIFDNQHKPFQKSK